MKKLLFVFVISCFAFGAASFAQVAPTAVNATVTPQQKITADQQSVQKTAPSVTATTSISATDASVTTTTATSSPATAPVASPAATTNPACTHACGGNAACCHPGTSCTKTQTTAPVQDKPKN